MKYTYENRYEAQLGLTGDRVCIVPDQVADDQHGYDGRTFPVLIPAIHAGWPGTVAKPELKMRVRLTGDDYDLNGSGTGDMVVRPLAYIV